MNDLLTVVAKKLKTLRLQNSWSLDLTSQKTTVSKAMLGQIERAESMPTISILWKIATGFQVPFSYFLYDGDQALNPIILQNNHEEQDDFKIKTMFPYDNNLFFEAFVIEVAPGCEKMSLPHQAGVVEHVIVSQGEMEVFADGQWHKIAQHQGFVFSADQLHGYKNVSEKALIFSNLIHYPKRVL